MRFVCVYKSHTHAATATASNKYNSMVSVGTQMEVEPDGTLIVGEFEKVLDAGETCSIAGDYVTCTCDEEDEDEECCDCIDQSVPVCEGVKCKEAKMRDPSMGSMSNVSGMSGLLSPGLMSPMSLGFGSPIMKKKKTPVRTRRTTNSPCCPGCKYPSGGPVCNTCGRTIEPENSGDVIIIESPKASIEMSSGVNFELEQTAGTIIRKPHDVTSGTAAKEILEDTAETSPRPSVGAAYRAITGGLSRIPTRGTTTPIFGATSRATAGTTFRTAVGKIGEGTDRKLYSSHIGTLHKAIVNITSKVQASDAIVVPLSTERKSRKKGYCRYSLESTSSDAGLKRNLLKCGNKKNKQNNLKNNFKSPRSVTHLSEGKCPVDNRGISVAEREDTDEVVYEDSERSILNTGNSAIPGSSPTFCSASYAGYSFLAGSGLCGPRVTGLEGSKSAHQVQDARCAGRHQGHATRGGSAVHAVDDAKLLLDGLSNSW